MRFSAPEHTTGATLTSGPVSVVDGVLEVADDLLTEGDRGGLVANGFVPLPDKPVAAPTVTKPPLLPVPDKPAE